MSQYVKILTVNLNQETTFNFSDIFPPFYDNVNEFNAVLNDNWSVLNISQNSGSFVPNPILPNWLTISDTDNINTLPYNLRNTMNSAFISSNCIYGTDYLKEFKVLFQSVGNYQINFLSRAIKPDGFILNNFFYFTFKVVEPIPPQPAIPQGIQYNTYDRVIRVEKNVATNKSFGTDGLYPNGGEIIISSTLPAWITNNTINSRTQTWDITAPSVNTYYYYGNVYLRNEFKGAATITLQVVESLFEEVDNCCSDENINIVWLNRQGGRGNFIFTQRRDFKVNIGDKKTYITKDIKRYSEINKVYNAVTVYATGLSLNQIDFLDTLRYSIQAWVFINEVFIPIILDVESFDKYNTKENMYDISITFNYAEQLNIQRQ